MCCVYGWPLKNVFTTSLDIKYTTCHLQGIKQAPCLRFVFKTRNVPNSSTLKYSYWSQFAKMLNFTTS